MSNPPRPAAKPVPKPAYVSSSGQMLDSLPLTARLNRAVDTLYNFVGLYFVSLLSLDPYSAAQNSRFNTRGPGRNTGSNSSSGPGTSTGLGFGSARLGGGGGGATSGPRGGNGGGGGSGGFRTIGTVDDIRGPECGSCR